MANENASSSMPAMLAPAVAETPAAMEAAPVGTPEPSVPGITETYRDEPAVGADVSEVEEGWEKEMMEGAEVEEEAEADVAEAQAVAAEEGDGLSREEVVRWLEIGLGAGVGVGVGVLVVLWAFARLWRSIGNRA